MNQTTCMQYLPVPRKGKKKQVKNEVDRIKQAEKKKRRLEKALATSAAIRAELEMKKQKKKEGQQELDREEEASKKQQVKDEIEQIKRSEMTQMCLENALAIRAELEKQKQKRLEEQQRLDEEGAAIAEAVALHVLLGEDSDDSHRIMANKEKGFNPWGFTGGRGQWVPSQGCANNAVYGAGALSNAYGLGNSCNGWSWSHPYEPYGRGWESKGSSAGLVAAQAAASSLQIWDSIMDNGILRGYNKA